jgi:hypothetical protein
MAIYNESVWKASRYGYMAAGNPGAAVGRGVAYAGLAYGGLHQGARQGMQSMADLFSETSFLKMNTRTQGFQRWAQQLPATKGQSFRYAARGVGMAPITGLAKGVKVAPMFAAVSMLVGEGPLGRRAMGGIGEAIGWEVGMTAGAAIGTAVLPGIGTVIGGGIGAIGGMMGGSAIGHEIYDIGAGKYNKRGLEFRGDMTAFMTKGAMTMRQQSVMAIQRSAMNTRSALGAEAKYMHFR